MTVPRWRKIALGLCLFLVTGSFGFLQPFTSPYYAASGLDKARIGLLTGIAGGHVQPLALINNGKL